MTKAGLVLLLCLAVTCSWRGIGQAQCDYYCSCSGEVNFFNFGFVSHLLFSPARCASYMYATGGNHNTASNLNSGQRKYCSNTALCFSGSVGQFGEDSPWPWDESDPEQTSYYQSCDY